MDKMKGLAKGGWHPSTDRAITKENWKSDLKANVGLGKKKKDPYEEARNHQSRPLASLRDPDSFGPPPKHSAYYGPDGQSVSRTGTGLSTASGNSRAGLGGPLVESGYAERRRQEAAEREAREQAEIEAKKAEPYRMNTSGLRTDNLPKPPVRRNVDADGAASPGASTATVASPVLPPRAPPRQTTGTIAAPARTSSPSGPAPFLPPRQNEYPDEYTPPPPPTYNEALSAPSPQQNVAFMAQSVASRFNQNGSSPSSFPARQNSDNPAAINQSTMNRLGQAGVSVPGLGIGSSSNGTSGPSAQQVQSAASMAHGVASRFNQNGGGGQLNELQQRFARMNTGASNDTSSAPASAFSAAAAQKKAPPPPPPKKAGLSAVNALQSGDNSAAPPPVPMSSKPKPT
ncbi:uncharacterized protein MYCFIDRAFT_210263 [Pseudocercospora fijiensis CIRAD86]|uniref:Uncharacterized protein n=1 Tax=Pseudocercospora fijiensis (strain CIRAD86) TaxID=383855 RepID=M3B8B9_PSEFD|nr:uncharacterized protein MYCFIDRAFT_210263 [Pseudocercospora fijiensis CIRAD86]EME85558.1 hypothetical protein MYCFIDRAFT_210263 [Pseudocercospora fijiensis CIRAD86]